jgi:hypothetical protein
VTPTIFLSASVPDPKRNPKYYESADRTAIRDAVRALVAITLPKMRLVWGGHPAITPLVRVIAEDMGATGSDRIRLYQSEFFRGVMPEENASFERIVYTAAVPGDREASLALMRREMFTRESYYAGVFIGGMEGVEDEYRLLREMQPNAMALPIASTGAAALLIFRSRLAELPVELETDLAYPTLFRRLLAQSL